MKVLIISTTALKTPPENYGGTELITYLISKELAKKGHQVTLAASQGSTAPQGVKLIETVPPQMKNFNIEVDAFPAYNGILEQFDIVHDHSWIKMAYTAKQAEERMDKIKLISTIHGLQPYATAPPVKFPNLVGLSSRHAEVLALQLKVTVRWVNNGIDPTRYYFEPDPGDRLLFLSRVTAYKGALNFADICNRSRSQGDLVGDDRFVEDHTYVRRVIDTCQANKFVRYWGTVSHERKVMLLAKAKCLISPLMWDEPFGLHMVEANMCGTPVIAYARGGAIDIVKKGVNGYLVRNDVEAIKALDKIDKIDRKKCREFAEERFSDRKMAEGYLELYNSVMEGSEW